MATAYPAPGKILGLADYNKTPVEPVWASMRHATVVIPNGSYSMPEPWDSAQTARLRFKYASAPGGVTTIEIATDQTFADAQILDTVAAGAATASFWSLAQGVAYSGFIRINNTSGVAINEVRVQEQVSSVGTA